MIDYNNSILYRYTMVSVRLVLEILLIITQVTGQLDTVKLATILSHNISNKLLGFQDLQVLYFIYRFIEHILKYLF